jgi:hypothetical protein
LLAVDLRNELGAFDELLDVAVVGVHGVVAGARSCALKPSASN